MLFCPMSRSMLPVSSGLVAMAVIVIGWSVPSPDESSRRSIHWVPVSCKRTTSLRYEIVGGVFTPWTVISMGAVEIDPNPSVSW